MKFRAARSLAALFVLAAMLLSACGFQLRGSNGQSTLPFDSIYVALPDTSMLGAELKRYIRASGNTEIAKDPKAAQAILEVLSEARNKSILTLNSQGRIREYSLFYNVRFQLKDNQGKELLPPTNIALKRDISYNESQANAKEKEEELLYRDMQHDAVQQILRRLAALKNA